MGLSLALAACSAPPSVERDPAPLIQTDALEYPLVRNDVGYRTSIPFTFRNLTGEAVHLPNCDGDVRPVLEMRRGTSWFEAWTPYRQECVSDPVVIPAGGTFTDTLEVFGAPPASNVLPIFTFPEIEGVYRLVWTQAMAPPAGTEEEAGDGTEAPGAGVQGTRLPLEQRVSNPFVLRR